MSKLSCTYYPLCSGCNAIGEDIDSQKNKKIKNLQQLVQTFQDSPEIGWISPGIAYLRDRLDFIWDDGKLGLFSKSGSKVVDIESCAQLSPALNSWYQEFRKIKWPIKRGSIRLRIGPQGQKGAWLDFANYDIKNLLEEKKTLRSLLKMAHIEMGQKRKVLKDEGKELKLRDPEPNIWFESLYREEKIPLYCHIGSFTQPSLHANHMILHKLQSWVRELRLPKAAEFGSGIGNLSVMLLGESQKLRIFENDTLSVEAFQKSLNEHPTLSTRKNDVELNVGDYHKKQDLSFETEELLLVNPPRSGLKGFLETLQSSSQRPQKIIYMSCAPESWSADGRALKQLGYTIQKLEIADQFPQTQHFEILSLWST